MALITDEPPVEAQSAGHNRCPINLIREAALAWLTPPGRSCAELFEILGQRHRPYYEHRIVEARLASLEFQADHASGHILLDQRLQGFEQRFALHGLKHRGITDTKGKKAEKKEASGHKTDAMLDLYDHEVAVVEPARAGEAEGVL